ncbi:MAG TPA: hypothetical protein DEO68_07900 [Halomonas campaniensis]|uniref:Uncharacterized protein n=1 Tax=Halomonas campaniensis TaxID=213554 RepID=A0A3D0KFL5_9GAMM|nr:hypothetical protein [Halomonas sp. 3F2F]HCA02090.1 hypothetical protein [Halomonas campaniensis]
MTSSHETPRASYGLSLQGYSLEHIAERLHTSDDRISQMIAKYQRQLPAATAKPWWHGLSSSTRILLEELGLHSHDDVEQAYQEGAFTQGHPNLLRGLSERTLRQITSWLDQPNANAVITKTAECPLTLTLNAECAHHLEWLSRAAHITPTVLVEKLINEGVRRRYGSQD